MKIVIAGSRTLTDRPKVEEAIQHLLGPLLRLDGGNIEILHGGCPKGVDSIAHDMLDGIYPIAVYPADWTKHGRSAGPIRNRQMAEVADVLILVWDGKSRGSANMKAEMVRLKKPFAEVVIEPK